MILFCVLFELSRWNLRSEQCYNLNTCSSFRSSRVTNSALHIPRLDRALEKVSAANWGRRDLERVLADGRPDGP